MAFECTFRLQDAYGRTTRRTYVSDRAAATDVASDATSMITLLEATSLCAVIETKISEITIVAGSPESGANVDAGGTIRVRLDNNKLYGIHVPGIDPALVNVDGSLILADDAITDLVDAFKSSGHWKLSETNRAVSITGGELDI